MQMFEARTYAFTVPGVPEIPDAIQQAAAQYVADAQALGLSADEIADDLADQWPDVVGDADVFPESDGVMCAVLMPVH